MKKRPILLTTLLVILLLTAFLGGGLSLGAAPKDTGGEEEGLWFYKVEAIPFDTNASHTDIPEGWEPFAMGYIADYLEPGNVLYIFVREKIQTDVMEEPVGPVPYPFSKDRGEK